MQGIFVFDLSVNTRKCGISHNKTSARNRSLAQRIRSPRSRSNSGGNRPRLGSGYTVRCWFYSSRYSSA